MATERTFSILKPDATPGARLQAADLHRGRVCAKVARYAERIHHPDRLLHPMRRTGPKGSGQFARSPGTRRSISIAEKFLAAEREFGAEIGLALLLRRHHGPGDARRHQPPAPCEEIFRFYSTICANPAWTGFAIGTGKIAGVDPREMASPTWS
jgi:hypothetical protein